MGWGGGEGHGAAPTRLDEVVGQAVVDGGRDHHVLEQSKGAGAKEGGRLGRLRLGAAWLAGWLAGRVKIAAPPSPLKNSTSPPIACLGG